MNKTEEKLAYLFARDQNTKELHATADGRFFTEKHRAEAHAGTLSGDGKDKVKSWSRQAFEVFQSAKAKKEAAKAEVTTEETPIEVVPVEETAATVPAEQTAAEQETAEKQPAKQSKAKTKINK